MNEPQKEKEKYGNNKKNFITFIIVFFITLMIFYNFITMHYATDTYNIINRGYEDYAIKYSLNDGRPIMCLISLLASRMHIPIEVYIITLTVMAIFISCLNVFIIKNTVIKFMNINGKKEWMILIISYVIIFNFTYLENMQFAECMVMAISVLMNTLVAKIIVEKNKNYITKSIILSILSMLCYQGTMNWIVTLTCFLSIMKEKKLNKEVLKNIALSATCVVIGVICDLIQIRISGKLLNMTQNRMGSIKNIPKNIYYIFSSLGYILTDTYNLFPKYIFILYIIALISIDISKGSLKLTNILLIVIIAIATTFAPYIFTTAGFGTARMAFSIGALIGLLILYCYCNIPNNKKLKISICVILFTYLILIIMNYIYIMNEHKKVNLQDKMESKIIGQMIEEYENENNIKIQYIVILYDGNSKAYYENIKNTSVLCLRSLYPEWSRAGVINYYNNRTLKEPKETQGRYIHVPKDKEFDELTEKRIIFHEDTVYYCP